MAKMGARAEGSSGITKELIPNTLVDETLAVVRKDLSGW